MGDNSFHTTVESLFKGMDSFITTKTVVGDAIHIGDTIILPLVDVSFGVAAGAFSQEKKNNGAGGMGGKITPSAVLVIQNGTTKLVNIKNQDGLTKVLDMVPDFVNKFTSKGEKENVVEESEDDSVAKKTAAKEMEQILSIKRNNFNGFSNIRCFVISYTREKTLKFIGCVLGDLFAVDFVAR